MEIIAAIVPYLSLPSILAGRDVIHWIDNTSALAAMLKGYSGSPDSARLVHTFHAWAAAARCSVWFEYVPSEANPSDEPSRDLSLATSQWQVAPGCTSSPVAAVFPPLERLSHPRGWMIEANAVASGASV